MSQSLTNNLIHLTFSTKFHQPFLNSEIEKELFPYLSKIFRSTDSPVISINGTKDHIHILFSLSKKIALCSVIERVKKNSSKWIKTKGTKYKNFRWQNGYAAFSVDQSNIERIKKYITNQKIHHQKRIFREEYLLLVKKYKMPYDEKYLWD
jgi:REP element-mobilizing transposase RayT